MHVKITEILISCGYIFIKCSNKEILWEKDDGEFLQKKKEGNVSFIIETLLLLLVLMSLFY